MKVLGISVGRPLSNTEIFVKEALMGAQAAGADVEFIRLHDYKIKPCTGCNQCVVDLFERNGRGACTIKDDDFDEIDEKIMECDGLIVGSPIYEKSPSGLLKTLNDRMGPSHDVAFRMVARDLAAKKGLDESFGPDPRSFKKRTAALIAVGGSEWDNLVLPMLHLFALPMQIDVVDKFIVNWTALPGAALFREEWLQRAHAAGRQVVTEWGKENPEFIGEEGLCPLCHSKLFEVRNGDANYPTICGICGVSGTLKVDEEGKVSFTIAEEDVAHSHVLLSGKFQHADELNQRSLVMDFDPKEKARRLEKYKTFIQPTKPTRK